MNYLGGRIEPNLVHRRVRKWQVAFYIMGIVDPHHVRVGKGTIQVNLSDAVINLATHKLGISKLIDLLLGRISLRPHRMIKHFPILSIVRTLQFKMAGILFLYGLPCQAVCRTAGFGRYFAPFEGKDTEFMSGSFEGKVASKCAFKIIQSKIKILCLFNVYVILYPSFPLVCSSSSGPIINSINISITSCTKIISVLILYRQPESIISPDLKVINSWSHPNLHLIPYGEMISKK